MERHCIQNTQNLQDRSTLLFQKRFYNRTFRLIFISPNFIAGYWLCLKALIMCFLITLRHRRSFIHMCFLSFFWQWYFSFWLSCTEFFPCLKVLQSWYITVLASYFITVQLTLASNMYYKAVAVTFQNNTVAEFRKQYCTISKVKEDQHCLMESFKRLNILNQFNGGKGEYCKERH